MNGGNGCASRKNRKILTVLPMKTFFIVLSFKLARRDAFRHSLKQTRHTFQAVYPHIVPSAVAKPRRNSAPIPAQKQPIRQSGTANQIERSSCARLKLRFSAAPDVDARNAPRLPISVFAPRLAVAPLAAPLPETALIPSRVLEVGAARPKTASLRLLQKTALFAALLLAAPAAVSAAFIVRANTRRTRPRAQIQTALVLVPVP